MSNKFRMRVFPHLSLQEASKRGHIGQLQSQVQRTDFNQGENDHNVPESWKWENLANTKDKKERKGKNRKRKAKDSGKSPKDENTEE